MSSKQKTIVGKASYVDIPEGDVFNIPAKIDTGAYRTSVWASDIAENNGVLSYKLLGPESSLYSGKECSTKEYEIVEVENSFGQKEDRYSVHITIKLESRKVRTNVTLSDRSSKYYPILIGRKMLKGKFIVDVSQKRKQKEEKK